MIGGLCIGATGARVGIGAGIWLSGGYIWGS